MNANVGAYLSEEDFTHDKNPHKYALLWASKFYRVLNNVMRNVKDVSSIPPYTKEFVSAFVAYFKKHGIKKQAVMALTRCLYRGVDKTYRLKGRMQDNGFISTSRHLDVAKRFSGGSGKIIHLKTRELPDNVPFVRIDETLAEYLHEQEILLLPGELTLTIVNKEIRGIYNVNKNIMDIQHGGKMNESIESLLFTFGDDKMVYDLRGRVVIWWKHDGKGNVESLNFTRLPHKGINEYWKRVVLDIDDYLTSIMDYMPDDCDKLLIFMAIVNPKNLEVETLHYGMPRNMFEEHFDVTKYEKKCVQKLLEDNSWCL